MNENRRTLRGVFAVLFVALALWFAADVTGAVIVDVSTEVAGTQFAFDPDATADAEDEALAPSAATAAAWVAASLAVLLAALTPSLRSLPRVRGPPTPSATASSVARIGG